jgi:DNA-binding response OmpR family regulator
MRILYVEGEELVARGFVSLFRALGWDATWIRTGEDAVSVVGRTCYDLGILDAKLPGTLQGLDVCREMKLRLPSAGVVFLTALDEPRVRADLLEAGADECLGKDVDSHELRARLRALERRFSLREPRSVGWELGPLRVSLLECDIRVDGKRVFLSMAQWAVLVAMLKRANEPVSREDLIRTAGLQDDETGVNLRCLIEELRSRLGRAGALVQTARGVGYGVALDGSSGIDVQGLPELRSSNAAPARQRQR